MISTTATAAPTLAPMAVVLVLGPVSELDTSSGSDVGIDGDVEGDAVVGSAFGAAIAADVEADVGADVDNDPDVSVAGDVVDALAEEVEDIVLEVGLVADDSCALEVVTFVGRIQN